MKYFFSFIFLFIAVKSFSNEKHALIIAIGDYPKKTGWSAISSEADVPLIKNALLTQGFSAQNITTLINEQATKKGIVEAIDALEKKAKKGDIVVIHYSGHGQQIFDDNGDEVDGLDEALVPYDAFAKYTHSYQGENHLRDDQLGNIIAAFRNKLGKDGQLLFILDSCHSGSATRGAKTRGGQGALIPSDWKAPDQNVQKQGSGLLERTVVSPEAAPFVMISGASADELNYEYNGVGSLSYAFSKALNELGTDFSYRQLFSSVSANMNVISPKQNPTIEGDVDFKLFKGEYVKQQPYFDVTKVLRSNTIVNINGGQLNRIFDNTTVFVVPAGTTKVDESKALAKGKVTSSKFGEAIVVLDKALKDDNAKNYWVFIDQPSYGNIAVNVFLDASVVDSSVKTGISDFLNKNKLGEIVSDINAADIAIDKKNGSYTLSYIKGDAEFGQLESSRGDAISEITSKIFNYAQGGYLKNLSLKNSEYEFEFKLVPVEYDQEIGLVGNIKSIETNVNESGIFQVKPGEDFVVLEITNKSTKPLYISIVEINSAGEISPFFPNGSCSLNNNERRLSPGQTMLFKDCVYSFGPPYERLVLKGFASDKPLNFQSTVNTRGKASANQNPLEAFLQQTYNLSRGSESNAVATGVGGYSNEFVYDIIRK